MTEAKPDGKNGGNVKATETPQNFHDVHVHIMNLGFVSFSPLLSGLFGNLQDTMSSGFMSESYLGGRNFLHLADTFKNTLLTFESPLGVTLGLLDSDIDGFVSDGLFRFRHTPYSSYTICPQCIDFSTDGERASYYSVPYNDMITPYAEATIEMMKAFRESHPDSRLRILPFLGINPKVHTADKIRSLLEKFCGGGDESFRGIKFYPPLGSDPKSDECAQREKFELILEFAEEHNLPVTIHCDNQGFRTLGAKETWAITNPMRWKDSVLRHPAVRFNFAHFGRQYAMSDPAFSVANHIRFLGKSITPGMKTQEWTDAIIEMMTECDNVYADVSYSLTDPIFLRFLENLTDETDSDTFGRVSERLLFGSDFSINLLKVRSYADYLKLYENSKVDDWLVERTVGSNPERFLFGPAGKDR